jgi:hypothetical protein
MPERGDVNERLRTQTAQTTDSFGAIGASRTPVTWGRSISIDSGQRGRDVDLQRRGWAHVSTDGRRQPAPHFGKNRGPIARLVLRVLRSDSKRPRFAFCRRVSEDSAERLTLW